MFFLQTFLNVAVRQCFFPLVRETVEIIMVVELHNKIPQTDRDTHTHIKKMTGRGIFSIPEATTHFLTGETA